MLNGFECRGAASANYRPRPCTRCLRSVDEAGYPAPFRPYARGVRIRCASAWWCIAPGIDRIVMILANEPNIREVITFPEDRRRAIR